jgi:hypothetical protein
MHAPWLGLLLASTLVLAPGGDGDDDDCLKEIRRMCESISRKVEDGIGDVKRELDPAKKRDLETRLRRAVAEARDAVDPHGEMVRVRFEGKERLVPEQKGIGQLY